MKCQFCGADCRKGVISAPGESILYVGSIMTWYPEDQKDKLMKKHGAPVEWKGDAYYCENCKRAFAVFEDRYV